MGLDDALLQSSAPATLRFYSWSPPGLSLGFFQEQAAFADVPGSHQIVRRSTGGGAIYHQEEITFSLSLDIRSDSPGIIDWYVGVHQAVRAALRLMDIAVEFPDKISPVTREDQRRGWCFDHPGPQDLISKTGGKILGSAQRRIQRPRPRLLHHASLIMRAPSATPDCGAVADYRPPEDVREDLVELLSHQLSNFLGLSPSSEGPDEAELKTAEKLAMKPHGDPDHLLRR